MEICLNISFQDKKLNLQDQWYDNSMIKAREIKTGIQQSCLRIKTELGQTNVGSLKRDKTAHKFNEVVQITNTNVAIVLIQKDLVVFRSLRQPGLSRQN